MTNTLTAPVATNGNGHAPAQPKTRASFNQRSELVLSGELKLILLLRAKAKPRGTNSCA